MKVKKATREKMIVLIKKNGGRIGTKDIKEINDLVLNDKLLEAFFSIITRLQYQLQANFHNKFHVDWEKISNKEPQPRDVDRLWKTFSKKVNRFSTIIFISYSTELIQQPTYAELNKLRDLRNQLAHNLTYYEPKIFITQDEVKNAIKKGIEILHELEKTQNDIVFNRHK